MTTKNTVLSIGLPDGQVVRVNGIARNFQMHPNRITFNEHDEPIPFEGPTGLPHASIAIDDEETEKELEAVISYMQRDDASSLAMRIVEERQLWRQLVEATNNAADSSWCAAVGHERAQEDLAFAKQALRDHGIDVGD